LGKSVPFLFKVEIMLTATRPVMTNGGGKGGHGPKTTPPAESKPPKPIQPPKKQQRR
jgi:hypothetical protein